MSWALSAMVIEQMGDDMPASELSLELPILLPRIEDERDQCVERLQEQLKQRKGIEAVHLRSQDGQALLCLHYDPDLVTLERVQRLATGAGATVTERYQHETLRVTSMDCADCAASIEHILQRVPGVLVASVNYAAEKMRIEYDRTQVSHTAIVQRMRALGYRIEERRTPTWIASHAELLLALASGLFLALGASGGWLLGWPTSFSLVCYVLAYLTGGYEVSRHGIAAALHLRFEMDLLMMIAAIGAAILGDWAEGALLLFLFSLGHALEHSALDRARHAVEALGALTPKTARVRRDGREAEVGVEELLRGDVVIVRPGERLPVDGTVLEGRSALDQSPVTGESIPVEKRAGDSVFAGTVNGDGALEVSVTKLANDTTLARVMRMVEEAQTQKSPAQQLTERFSHVFVPAILVSVVVVILTPSLLGWLSFQAALLRGMTMLVAASPCALAIGPPAAVLSGIARAARGGVLIKGGVHLENLGRLKALAFDKTGTVTSGKVEVTDLVPLDGKEQRDLLRVAAAVESRSTHPLAQAIVRRAHAEGLDEVPPVEHLQALAGKGLRAVVQGEVALVGNLALFSSESAEPVPQEIIGRVRVLEEEGKTTMVVRMGERYLGIIGLADRPRLEARAVMEQLQRLGMHTLVLLTGDHARVAESIAHEVGMTDYRAELLPEQKVEAIKALLATHTRVAMVGDGVNDAPALATATVGIAMGTGGTDVALETADVALMADDLSALPLAVGLGRASRRVILQNLVIAFGVIAILIPAALFGIASIGLAIVLHEGSTLVVVANALRLLGYTPRD